MAVRQTVATAAPVLERGGVDVNNVVLPFVAGEACCSVGFCRTIVDIDVAYAVRARSPPAGGFDAHGVHRIQRPFLSSDDDTTNTTTSSEVWPSRRTPFLLLLLLSFDFYFQLFLHVLLSRPADVDCDDPHDECDTRIHRRHHFPTHRHLRWG